MCVCARARVYAHVRIVKILKRMSSQIVYTHAHTLTHSHVIIASCTSMYNFIYVCKCTFTQICINRRSGWRSATRYSTPSKSRRRTQEQVAPLHVYCLLSFSHALSVPLSLQLTHSVSHAHARTHAHTCTIVLKYTHAHRQTTRRMAAPAAGVVFCDNNPVGAFLFPTWGGDWKRSWTGSVMEERTMMQVG